MPNIGYPRTAMRIRKTRRVTARYKWDRLRVSFWFAPVVMSLVAMLLVWVMYWVDDRIHVETLQGSHLILSGTPAELRTMLVGMATTTLATAGVVFTLLTLPLSTVAAQYGSRLLRVFLGDRTTQLVLGMFAATFVYCLAAATSMPVVKVHPDSPQITATVGMFLMLGTFASLVVLVQHISTMLQAPNIAAAAGAELWEVICAEIPDEISSTDGRESRFDSRPDQQLEIDGYAVQVRRTGYIQYIDPEIMLTLAREKNLVIRLLRKPGQFIQRGMSVAMIWPADRANEVDQDIRHAFQIGNGRTPTQDVAYAVNQLVEMALRAMSPAINDPYTAMTCLDYIGEGLARFIRQGEKNSRFYDSDCRLCLISEPVTFDELLSTAFDMLRHCSCDNAAVLQHMLAVFDAISQEACSAKARKELLRHVNLVLVESQAGRLIEQDRQLIQRRGSALQTKLADRERQISQ